MFGDSAGLTGSWLSFTIVSGALSKSIGARCRHTEPQRCAPSHRLSTSEDKVSCALMCADHLDISERSELDSMGGDGNRRGSGLLRMCDGT